jgi:starch synthase
VVNMYIVQIVTELCNVARAGGLADVIYGLSKQLYRQGHQVEIILPKYDCLNYTALKNLKVEFRELWSFEGVNRYNNTIWSADIDGLKLLLVEPHHPQYYFSRGIIYGCHDDIDRFVYFSRTAMEFLFKSGRSPDAIHVHDWPTALVPVLYKEMYQPLGYKAGGTLLTIHNMEHQGRCHPFNLSRVGLRGDSYLAPDKMQDLHSLHLINLLKGGIEFADKITTVSPTYEKEIQTPKGGFGLEKVLVKNRKKLKGISNGIDEDFWNPEKDLHLIQKYSTYAIDINKLSTVLKAKKENKQHLRLRLGIKNSNAPLIGSVTRLVPQKSPELIKYSIYRTLDKGGQYVLLGATPILSIQKEFEALKEELKNNDNIAIVLDNDEALAHQIFASADMVVIPSLFEPCGLTQLIALRYGAVPIVRLTGGLSDTVFDIDTSPHPIEMRNGFTFDFPDRKGVDWALLRALDCFKREPQKWQSIINNGIRQDFSWKNSAIEYLSLYRNLYPSSPPVAEKQDESAKQNPNLKL